MKTIFLTGLLLWLAACNIIPENPEPESVAARKVPPVAPPAQPTGIPQPKVAILDPDNDVDELARYRQALLESSVDPLESGDVGYYIDILEARLIQQVRGNTVTMKRQDNTFTLLISGSEVFESNRSKLKPGVRGSLASITGVLEEYHNIQISIFGHTDERGDEGYNLELSVRRAQAVARYLIDGGIAARRIAIIGYGESRPTTTNRTAEGRALNRRIELVLTPMANLTP